jgi:putative hydrolase of the HAD superfamily
VYSFVIEFLDAVRCSRRWLVLVTNAHIKSLDLKMQKTQLQGHFDRLICSHDFGLPKEDAEFWDRLRQDEPFEPASTLLVDDSLPVLHSARRYGIAHLLAVHQPDTKSPAKDVEDFPAIRSFQEIMP